MCVTQGRDCNIKGIPYKSKYEITCRRRRGRHGTKQPIAIRDLGGERVSEKMTGKEDWPKEKETRLECNCNIFLVIKEEEDE